MRSINESIQKEIVSKKQEYKQKKQEESKLKISIKQLKEELAEVDNAIAKTLHEQELSREAQAKDNQQLADVTKQLELLRAKAEEEMQNEQRLKDEVAAAQTALQNEKQKEEELQTRLQELRRQNSDLEARNKELEQVIAMKEAAARDAESQLAITKQKIADEKQSYNMSKAQVDTETARSMELIQSKKQSVKMLTEKRDQLKRELEEETSVLNAQQDQITKLQMEIASAQITKPNRNQMQTPIQSKPPPTSSVRKDRCLELFEENAFGAY